MLLCFHNPINSLRPSDAIRRQGMGQHWLRQWLIGWRHQTITWTNVDLSSARPCGIHRRALSWDLKIPVSKTRLEIPFLASYPDFPGANELKLYLLSGIRPTFGSCDVSKQRDCVPDSKVHGANMGPHLGPVGPRWAPCWPLEPCYLGCCMVLSLCKLTYAPVSVMPMCLSKCRVSPKPISFGFKISRYFRALAVVLSLEYVFIQILRGRFSDTRVEEKQPWTIWHNKTRNMWILLWVYCIC